MPVSANRGIVARTAVLAALLLSAALALGDEPARALPTWTSATYPMKEGEASVLRFSPDGKILALGTGGLLRGGTVKLLDARTLKELPIMLEEQLLAINALGFSADGKYLAAASGKVVKKGERFKVVTGAYVWDIEKGKMVAEIGGATGAFFCLCFSPDGKVLATGGQEVAVQLWDLATGDEKLAISSHAGAVHALTFSPDGKLVLSGAEDGAIHITDAANGKMVGALDGHPGGVRSLVPLKDGRTLVSTGNDGEVRVWDLSKRKQLRSFIVAAGSSYFVLGKDGRPQLVNRATVNDLSLTPDEARVAVGLFRTIKIFELATGKELAELVGHTGQLKTACFAPDGASLASGDNFDVRLWTKPPKAEGVRVFDNGLAVSYLAVSADGARFATPGSDSVVKVWDSAAGKVQWQDETQDDRNFSGLYALALSPDGKRLATSGYEKSDFRETYQVKVWDADTGRLLHTLNGHERPIHHLAFSPNGKVLASADEEALVRLWDTGSGQLLHTLKGHSGWLSGLAFSRDGKKLVSTAIRRERDELVGGEWMTWDVAAGIRTLKVEETDHSLTMPFFSADGRSLFCVGALCKPGHPRVFFVYQTETGKVEQRVPQPEGSGTTAVSGDDKWLAFRVGNDVHLWDMASRKPFAVLRGHSAEIADLAFTADGQRLFSAGSSDHTVREWDLRRAGEGKR